MELETDVVSHAFGSSRLRLANTDVLVAVKIEVDTPFPEHPNEGKLEFFVDWYTNSMSVINDLLYYVCLFVVQQMLHPISKAEAARISLFN